MIVVRPWKFKISLIFGKFLCWHGHCSVKKEPGERIDFKNVVLAPLVRPHEEFSTSLLV